MEIARITKGTYYGFRGGKMVRLPQYGSPRQSTLFQRTSDLSSLH